MPFNLPDTLPEKSPDKLPGNLPEHYANCTLKVFLLRLSPFILLFIIGGIAMLFAAFGHGTTGLSDHFSFGLWTAFGFILAAFGSAAFFTGFLRYILDIEPLKYIFNLAIVIGFICYSGVMLLLWLDTGQPLRAWFLLRYANPGSMFSIAVFGFVLSSAVLLVKCSALLMTQHQLKTVPLFGHMKRNLILFMPLFAALGAFVSVFHQGALGGMFGVLSGRPFAFREGFFIWPWTFFLFILSALGAGLMFTALINNLTEKISRKKLLGSYIKSTVGRIAGSMLGIYIVCKILDTLWWVLWMLPKAGFDFEHSSQGLHFRSINFWLLVLELIICGVLPAILLICKNTREKPVIFNLAGILSCLGLCINRYTLVIQTQAQPILPFDTWKTYTPGLIEWAVVGMIIAYGVIVLSLACRYLHIFDTTAIRFLDAPSGAQG
jgi:molybdopterin-containing oxidoreductase family membrane subunit